MADENQTNEKTKKGGETTKKNNLMSIIDSLRLSTPDNSTQQNDVDKPSTSASTNKNSSSTANVDFQVKMEQSSTTGMNPASFVPDSPEITQERDVIDNILKVLTQANNLGNTAPNSQSGNTEDESILEMQDSTKSGVHQLLSAVANGTNHVKSILKNDVNVIYECKRCRGMFRALPNLIRHKKEFCKNTGVLSSFMNRETNSTAEEDAGFQSILDTLHPPVNQFDPQLITNTYPEQYHTPITTMYRGSAKSTFTVTFPTPKVQPSTSQQYIVSSNPSLPMPHKKTINIAPNHSGVPVVQKKGFPCSVCKRELSDRKSVRRHLIHVHGMNVMEAIKLTHSTTQRNNSTGTGMPRNTSAPRNNNNTSTPKPKAPVVVKKPVKRVYNHSGNLHEIAIDVIDVGNDRKIHVLPEDFAISSSECPVCARTLCRRTNVRRHLLEAHQFIIKGERKYHQLKEISVNKIPGSPSLRNLRNVGMLSESLTSLKSTETEKISNAKSLTFDEMETSVGNNEKTSTTTMGDTEKDDKTLPFVDISRKADTNSENGTNESATLLITKLSNTSTNSESNDETMASDPGTVETVKDLSPYKCPECTKTFTRRQTFKNHMSSFHKCSEKKFEGMFGGGDSDAPVTDKESTKEVKKGSVKKERRSSNELEQPPKKIRKSDLSQLFTKLPSFPNFIKNERIGGEVKVTTAPPKCIALIPVSANDVVKGQTTIVVGNGANFLHNGASGKANPIFLKPLQTSSTPISQTSIRPFIQVKLNRSIVATKTVNTNTVVTAKQVQGILQTKIVSPPRTKSKEMYDIGKKICYSCDKVFESPQAVKAHLTQVHSLSHQDAHTFSTECSNVRPADQEAGLENGFDILSAKCLICDRLYFSRSNLTKHMLKFHHIMPDRLKGLIVPQELKKPGSKQIAVQSTSSATNSTQKPSQSPRHQLRNVKKVVATAKTTKRTTSLKQIHSPQKITMNGNCYVVSEESILKALEKFPKELINPQALRCLRCKRKYKKMWDLKIHLLRHVGLGLYACKHCPKPTVHMTAVRSMEVLKHLQSSHSITVTSKNRNHLASQCRINNEALWHAYNIPVGRTR